jgi:GLPGLI family protein
MYKLNMIKHLTLLFFIFFSHLSILSQDALITYKIGEVNKLNLDDVSNANIRKTILDASQKMGELEFILSFNKKESLFRLKDNVIYSDPSFKIAKSMADAEFVFYNNLQEKRKIRQIEIGGKV